MVRNRTEMLGRGMMRRGMMRRGMTLVELLIVVTIISLLVGISVPLLRTSIRENRIREASRMLNALVARAKARAAETSRAVAIEFVRNAPGSNAVTEAFLAETPNSFTGDLLGARSEVFFDPTPGQLRWEITFRDGNSPSLSATGNTALIKPGEDFRIQFGHRGAFYNAFRDATNGNYVIRVPPSMVRAGTPPDDWTPPAGFWLPGADGEWGVAGVNDDGNVDAAGNPILNDIREAGDQWPAVPPAPASDDVWVGLPYQIRLHPRRVSSSVLQLPEGTVIDLAYSGMGIAMMLDRTTTTVREEKFSGVDFHAANTSIAGPSITPVRITFGPGGDLESVSFGGNTYPPTGPVHLLVGLLEQMVIQDDTPVSPNPLPWSTVENTLERYDKNISDPTAIWVSIGYRTGSVTSSENGWLVSGTPPNFIASLLVAREFAQSAQTMGGR